MPEAAKANGWFVIGAEGSAEAGVAAIGCDICVIGFDGIAWD